MCRCGQVFADNKGMICLSDIETARGGEAAAHSEETALLKREVSRLNRELRSTKTFLNNATQAMTAKDALSRVLSNTNAKQRAYTDMLMESCPNIILLFDLSGCIVLSTKVFLTETGIHNFDFVRNQHYRTLFSDYVVAEVLDQFGKAVDHVLATSESFLLHDWIDFTHTGRKRYYSIEISTGGTDAEGKINGFIVVFVDLTEIMREKQRAERASTAKSDFLATMSHEIRTPMNAILGMSEMLSRSRLDVEQAKYLSDIRKSSQSLLTIINDILDFSKVEAGKMELVNANYSLRGLLDNLHSMFRHLFEVKRIAFRFLVDDGIPAYAYGDETRLRQIATNLISNALKYTNAGAVEVRVFLREGFLCMDIQDTGIGIREEDMGRLFAPFEQLDLRKNKNIVGTGLGLAISYNLCKIMGGGLWLESVYGEGSTFHAEIPFAPSEAAIAEENAEGGEFTAPQARILVVDDIDINLAVAEAMLSLFDIQPVLAPGGMEGIQLAKQERFDIIFMDHMMPEIDGIEATKIIRKGPGPNTNTLIVALTANAVSGMEEMFLTNGFDAFVSKPLAFDALSQCLRRWLPSEYIMETERT